MAQTPRSQDSGPKGSGENVTGNLAARIARAQQERAAHMATQSRRHGDMTGMSRALRFAAEFMAAIIVGTLIGYTIDFALGTTPWFMIALLMVGFAAGVLNVVRAAAEANAAAASQPATQAGPDDENDDD